MKNIGIALAGFALATAAGTQAYAQTYEGELAPRGPVRAPQNAFEISANSGYTQGFGAAVPATQGTRPTELGQGLVGAGIGLGYRATPNTSVGVVGQYNMQATRGGGEIKGATAGVDATYHASPNQRLDPWISLGAGYRMQWNQPEGPGNDTLIHGFQLARANLGMDIRVSDSVALAPTVGGDVSMFLWRNPEGSAVGNMAIKNPKINGFVFAGVQGRFDLGGQRIR